MPSKYLSSEPHPPLSSREVLCYLPQWAVEQHLLRAKPACTAEGQFSWEDGQLPGNWVYPCRFLEGAFHGFFLRPAKEIRVVFLPTPSCCHTNHWQTVLLQHTNLGEITRGKCTVQPLKTFPSTAWRPRDSLHPRKLCILNLYLGKICLHAWPRRFRGNCNILGNLNKCWSLSCPKILHFSWNNLHNTALH